jgi:hypothetical protein
MLPRWRWDREEIAEIWLEYRPRVWIREAAEVAQVGAV